MLKLINEHIYYNIVNCNPFIDFFVHFFLLFFEIFTNTVFYFFILKTTRGRKQVKKRLNLLYKSKKISYKSLLRYKSVIKNKSLKILLLIFIYRIMFRISIFNSYIFIGYLRKHRKSKAARSEQNQNKKK